MARRARIACVRNAGHRRAAKCRAPKAATTRPRTPIAKASKANISSGSRTRFELTRHRGRRALCAYYDVTPEGNGEGLSVLRVQRSHDAVAAELGISTDELRESLARAVPILYEARSQRVAPLLDDKVLVAWNGLMIDAFAIAARVFPERGYAESASRAASFLLEHLARPDGGLYPHMPRREGAFVGLFGRLCVLRPRPRQPVRSQRRRAVPERSCALGRTAAERFW